LRRAKDRPGGFEPQKIQASDESHASQFQQRARRRARPLFDRPRQGRGALARLRPPVDEFFLKVTVNADDPELRLNRLRLLGELRDAVHTVADFSRIAG